MGNYVPGCPGVCRGVPVCPGCPGCMENNKKTKVFRGNQWKTIWKHRFPVGTYGKNIRKTLVFRGNQLKTVNTCFPWEPIRKHYENISFPWEPMENTRNTQVFRGNQWQTHWENSGFQWEPIGTLWKHMFSVEANGRHYENTGVQWEPVENIMKTQVFRVNLWKTLWKHRFSVWTFWKH